MFRSAPTRLERAGGKSVRLFTISPYGRSRDDAAPYLRAEGANIPDGEKVTIGTKGYGRVVRIKDFSDSRSDWRKWLKHHPAVIAEPLPGYEQFEPIQPGQRGYDPTHTNYRDVTSLFQVIIPTEYRTDSGNKVKLTMEDADAIFDRINGLWMVTEVSQAVNIAPPRGAAGAGQFSESSKKRTMEAKREAIAKAEDREMAYVATAHGGTKNNIAPAEKGRKTPRAIPAGISPNRDVGTAIARPDRTKTEQEQICNACRQMGLDPYQEIIYLVKDAVLVDTMAKDEYGREYQKRRADGSIMQHYVDKPREIISSVQAIVAELIRLQKTDPTSPRVQVLFGRLPL